jgi:hypothetical protein
VEGEQEAQAEHLQTAPPEDERVEPPKKQEDRRQGQGREQAAPEDERLAGEVDSRDDDGHEAPARRDRRDGCVPGIETHSL